MPGAMGGYRQQIEMAMQLCGDAPGCSTDGNMPSVLVTKLLKLWTHGELSATAAQDIAHAALLDGLQNEEVATIANFGMMGLRPGNIARDMTTWYSTGIDVCQAVHVPVPCVDPPTGEYCVEEAAVFCPHLLFHALSKYDDFEQMFQTKRCSSFWLHSKQNDPRFVNNPMCEVVDWQNKFVPMYLHGDGVEFQDRELQFLQNGIP